MSFIHLNALAKILTSRLRGVHRHLAFEIAVSVDDQGNVPHPLAHYADRMGLSLRHTRRIWADLVARRVLRRVTRDRQIRYVLPFPRPQKPGSGAANASDRARSGGKGAKTAIAAKIPAKWAHPCTCPGRRQGSKCGAVPTFEHRGNRVCMACAARLKIHRPEAFVAFVESPGEGAREHSTRRKEG